LHIVKDGEEALDYLLHRGTYVNPTTAPRPDLFLLDLNMPKIDGRQVLQRIRADENLRRLAVVVLTTSQDDKDIIRSYDLGANSYIIKPIELQKFMQVIQALEAYWFQIVVLSPY
jgi:CheY-like chemotaxis protein